MPIVIAPKFVSKKRFTVKNVILILLALVSVGIAGAVVLIVYGFVAVSNACSSRTAQLQEMARQNVQYLNKMTIVDGQQVQATGGPDGDCLTGEGGPATAVFEASGSVSAVHAQVSQNLTAQDFTVSPTFYSDGPGNTSVTEIWTTATDGRRTLKIRYKLTAPYVCPAATPACVHKGIIEEAGLLNAAASQVTVTLGGVIVKP
ncbi:MAG TPA: hypothetical protein VLI54_00520 [Bacillota bacterium]|nr:hypothetical protein [Bacillota bacterium]